MVKVVGFQTVDRFHWPGSQRALWPDNFCFVMVSMAEIINFVPNVYLTKAGQTPHQTLENFKTIITAHGVKIFYNEMSKDVNVEIPNKNYLSDNKLNCSIAELISLLHSYRMASTHVLKFMLAVADENRVHPARTWIESKPWDQISRIDKFFKTLASSNEDLKEILMTRWMVSCVAALYEPEGLSSSGMLVLSGKTNMGKTNWFKNLLPIEQRFMSKDGMSIDPHKRDSLMPCLEHWLVELGEIDATFKKSDLAALKAFITSDRDVMRLAYMPTNSRFPRRTIFAATVDKKEFLRDPAGNRRFWAIECTHIDHTHGLDMQQIWAEFKVLYDNHEPWHLTADEFILLQESNKNFEVINPMEEKLVKKYDWSSPIITWKTATEILEEMGWIKPSISEASLCGIIIRKLNGDQAKRSKGRNLLGLPETNYA